MYKRLFTVLAAVALIFSVALSGQKARGPYRITGDEPARTVATSPGNPAPYSLGPGDSLGFTYYDYGTNGSANRNIVNFGDGQLSVARMASIDDVPSGTPSRGSYFKFFDGTSWSAGWSRVETVRRGWTNIDQIADAGGVEAVLSHVTEINLDAGRGANVWSSTIVPCAEGTWPKMAIANGFTIHMVASSGPTVIGYSVSFDAGATWTCDAVLYTAPGVVADADGYDITAQGNNVAFVVAGVGGDVVVLESADNGTTWTETVIYDIDETLLTAGEEVPDGSCSILYDSNGILHVAWGNSESMGDGATLLYSVDAGIRHWSSGTGVVEAAFPDPDPSIIAPLGRDGNLASQPDLSADAIGTVHIVFSRFINETDVNGNYYEHVFSVSSMDAGATWSGAIDLTPGTGFDASFPAVADLANPYLHIIYNCDAYAGNRLQVTPGHPDVQVAVMYLMTLPTSVEPVVGVIPSAYQLGQNYPNPFNPTTNIQYSIPQSSFVTLKVYDVLGREIAALVNQEQVAGSYVADFDAANLANGTYYYKLQAGDFTQTRKMMLVK